MSISKEQFFKLSKLEQQVIRACSTLTTELEKSDQKEISRSFNSKNITLYNQTVESKAIQDFINNQPYHTELKYTPLYQGNKCIMVKVTVSVRV